MLRRLSRPDILRNIWHFACLFIRLVFRSTFWRFYDKKSQYLDHIKLLVLEIKNVHWEMLLICYHAIEVFVDLVHCTTVCTFRAENDRFFRWYPFITGNVCAWGLHVSELVYILEILIMFAYAVHVAHKRVCVLRINIITCDVDVRMNSAYV